MSLWRQLTGGLRVLMNRPAADRDVADEIQDYLDRSTDAFLARGLSPDDARRAARIELGGTTIVHEQVRAYGWENSIGTLIADSRYAARRLRGSPGFTAVSVLTLALGIGASTAIFSAVSPILFEPLPYPQANRIVMISDVGISRAPLEVTFGTYREVAERSRAFDALAVMRPWQPTVTGAAQPERLDGQRVSADYFRVLGVHPAIGRDFTTSDDRLNGPRVVIISHAVWHRRFSGENGIVGREIRLNDSIYTVIGVMPQAFENVLTPSADVWTPLQYDSALRDVQGREWGHHLRMVGRLRAGVGIDSAAQDLDVIARSPIGEFTRPQWASLGQGFLVSTLQEDLTRGVRSALLAILGAVMLLLVIACVNVTNLLLARGAQRRGEFAMRVALGAGRGRLVRQMLTESLLLAVLGGALGMLVAQAGIQAFVALSPAGLPRVGAIGFDSRVFAFSLVMTTVVGLMVGLIPALQASRHNLHAGVQESTRRTAGGHQFARRALVVAEVALALVLLVGSGLLLRSLQQLFAIAPGFRPAGVLTLQVQTSGRRFDDDRIRHQFFAQALDAVRQVPGVEAAGFTSQLPLSGDWSVYGVSFQSSPTQTVESDEDRGAFRYAVSAGYIEALGIPVRSGRSLNAQDTAGAPPVAVINESFAKRRFPAGNAIGQRLRIGDPSGPWLTVVGIVGDVKQLSLALDQSDAVYLPGVQGRSLDSALSLVVRARGDAAALTPAVKNAIWSVDKDQPIVRIATMEHLLASSAAERRFALLLFEAFGLVALGLAGAGIYGVLSGSVAERTREIGVRAALGASRGAILSLILRQGMTLTGIGIVIGLIAAVVASRAIVSLLFAVSRLDAITYVGVVALLLGVAGIACWVPAWRAARIDPALTLRAD